MPSPSYTQKPFIQLMEQGMKECDYWSRLRNLKMMSLQRRRQRYLLIHTWKTYRELVPNSADMIFQTNPRLGVRAIPPFYQYRAEARRASQLHNSFGCRAARLWTIYQDRLTHVKHLVNSNRNSESSWIRFMTVLLPGGTRYFRTLCPRHVY